MIAARPRAYDAIVVGAGHNGLCLAAYLQRTGLSTLVLEQAPRAGGMTATEEPALPGFAHNVHANYLAYHELMPAVQDLGLEERGLRTVMPDAQHGIPFADGRPPIVLHRPGLLERTQASVARHSAADADVYVELKRRAMTLEPSLARGLYSSPARTWFEAHAATVDSTYAGLGITAGLATRTAVELIDELFESPEMRTAMYQVSAEFGVPLDLAGGALAFLGFQIWMTANWRLPLGGMRSVASALERACRDAGVTLATNARVEQVLVENGRATGVVVRDQGPLRARRLVASAAELGETLLELVGQEHLMATTRRQLRAFAEAPTSSLASVVFCLHEPPAYASARWDPDINRCFHTLVGYDEPQDVLTHVRDAQAGMLPTPAGATRVNTLWDASQAPAGHHVAGADCVFPAVDRLSQAEWDAVSESYNIAFLKRWGRLAPNMTRENVLADRFHPPGHFDRKVLLREGAAQYRTEIDGLYVCGASTHPGGGVHGACAYNAYQTIAADLGLQRPASAA